MMSPPIRRWQVVSTVAIVGLSVVSALLGLLRPDHYEEAFLPQYYAQDATILLVGVPALAFGLRSAIRGSVRGRIVWLGALGYMSYMWASIGLQVGFNRFFLGYVVLFGLSLFTFVGGLVSSQTGAIDRSFPNGVPERLYGGFLVAIALGLAALWLAELVPATVTGTPPALVEEQGPQALVSHFLDLGVVVPSLAIAGVWLWRRRPWGYVLAGVALAFGAILAPSIVSMTVVILWVGETTVSAVAIVFTLLPVVAAVALAITYVRLIPRDERLGSASEADERW